MTSRLKKVPEGRIVKSILRMRKKIKGPLKLRQVLEVVEAHEGVYVNRGLVTAKLEARGVLETINGVDMIKEPPWKRK